MVITQFEVSFYGKVCKGDRASLELGLLEKWMVTVLVSQVKNRHKLVMFETFSVYQQVNELTEAGLLFMEVNFDGYFWNSCEWLAIGGND